MSFSPSISLFCVMACSFVCFSQVSWLSFKTLCLALARSHSSDCNSLTVSDSISISAWSGDWRRMLLFVVVSHVWQSPWLFCRHFSCSSNCLRLSILSCKEAVKPCLSLCVESGCICCVSTMCLSVQLFGVFQCCFLGRLSSCDLNRTSITGKARGEEHKRCKPAERLRVKRGKWIAEKCDETGSHTRYGGEEERCVHTS